MYRATEGVEVIGVVVSQGRVVCGLTSYSNPRGITEFKRVKLSKRQIKSDKTYNMIFQTNRAEVIKLMEEHPEDNIIINSHIKGVTSKCYPWSKIHRR